jgi:hypothetical protein
MSDDGVERRVFLELGFLNDGLGYTMALGLI